MITDCGYRDSCTILFFKKLKILPLMSQYPPTLFVVYNRDQFLIISDIHNISTTVMNGKRETC
jgi:hypothetical protein